MWCLPEGACTLPLVRASQLATRRGTLFCRIHISLLSMSCMSALPATRPCSLLQAAIVRQTLVAPPGSSAAAAEGSPSPAGAHASAPSPPTHAELAPRSAASTTLEDAPLLQPPAGASWARLRRGVDAGEVDAALAGSNAAARKQVCSRSLG